MTTLNEVLEYLNQDIPLESEDQYKIVEFIRANGKGLYGVNFHGGVLPFKPEQSSLQDILESQREYYEEFTPPEDMERGFLLGEIDIFFEITEI